MSANLISLLNLLFVIVSVAVFFILVIRVGKALPSWETRQKYSGSIFLQSLLPFLKSWKGAVEPNDLDVIERFGKEMFRLFVFIWLFLIISLIGWDGKILYFRELGRDAPHIFPFEFSA